MKRVAHPTALAIVALLLPGLALAAPIAGACGLCGDGEGCHLQQPVGPSPEAHSCCETESESLPEPSFGSSKCECGRDAPPAQFVESSNTIDSKSVTAPTDQKITLIASTGSAFANSARPPAPPPAPPAYLIDCAFLT
jgi:hypothetical protein